MLATLQPDSAMIEENGFSSHSPEESRGAENMDVGTLVVQLKRKYFGEDELDPRIVFGRKANPGTGPDPDEIAEKKCPRCVVLEGCSIDRVGDASTFTSIASDVSDLHLPHNRLACWEQIAELMRLPELRYLNIGHNPLHRSISVTLPTANLLSTLILDGTNLPFSVVRKVVSAMPVLHELHFSDNRVEELLGDSCDLFSKSVSVVHVSRCEITRWDTVKLLLKLFPSCKSMFVCGNPLNLGIQTDEVDQLNGIEELNINDTLVDHWELLERLGEIPSLVNLHAATIPLMAPYSQEEKVYLVVGRMPHLQFLNGNTISIEDRGQAERFFLGYYDSWVVKPPIFAKLLEKHSHEKVRSVIALPPKTHASVMIVCEEIGLRTPVQLHLFSTVSEFKQCIEKITSIPLSWMRISFLGHPGNGFHEDLHNAQNFSTLGVVDGDHFAVQKAKGATVLEELERKYFSEEEVHSWIVLCRDTSLSTSPSKAAGEKCPRVVILDCRFIDRVGDYSKFLSVASTVHELDLSYNNLTCWEEISQMMLLPELRSFSIGHNPMERNLSVNLPTANLLRTFVLNETNLPFSTIRKLLAAMPVLKELHLSDNRVEELFDDGFEPLSKSVSVLHVSRCEITRWDTVTALHSLFPSCKSMFVCENPLKSGIQADHVALFNGIEELNLNNTLVDDWELIDRLGEVPSLVNLRALLIPLMNQYSQNERINLVIGRMPYLRFLNGTPISTQERERAERFFLRYYDSMEVKPPSLAKLIEKHGHLDQLCVVDLTPKTHATVMVFCEDTGVRSTMRVRLAWSVGWFKRSIEKVTGIPVHRMRLFYLGQPNMNCCPQELRISQALTTLRIEDGDHFSVQSKPVMSSKASSKR